MANIVLIPNGAGDETALDGAVGAATHWETCISLDNATSYVWDDDAGFARDLFNLEQPGLSGFTIEKVVVECWVAGEVAGIGNAQTSIKTNGVGYNGTAQNTTTTFTRIFTEYTNNPQSLTAWTWAEIDALQAGVVLKRPAAKKQGRCTHVRVVVYFTTSTQTFFPVDPVECTPGTANAWTDVDVSAYVPSGATGISLHCVNKGNDPYTLGLRKNGSTDNRRLGLGTGVGKAHCWAAIGIDADRIFEAYVGDATYINIYLVSYTVAGVTFFTNAYFKSPATGAWVDIDCATETPNAIGLIFELHGTSPGTAMGLRKKGSSDNRIALLFDHNSFGAIIGCDTSQICQGYRASGSTHFFLVGYITDGCILDANATDISLGTTDSWLSLAALPSNACMGFIEVVCTTGYRYGLRKKGSIEDIVLAVVRHCWAFVECDADRIIEGNIQTLTVDFFLVGYATVAVVGVTIDSTLAIATAEGLAVNIVVFLMPLMPLVLKLFSRTELGIATKLLVELGIAPTTTEALQLKVLKKGG